MKIVGRRLKRACDLIKSDRIGGSIGIEKAVSREVALALSEFFALSVQPKTHITATEKGFKVVIETEATSVKNFRSIV